MPTCASVCDIRTRDGSYADVANATASARVIRRGRLEGEYLVQRHEATELKGNAMASYLKGWMIDRSI